MNRRKLLKLIFVICIALPAGGASAQVEVVKNAFSWLNVRNDKRYIEDHSRDVTVRLYGANKFSGYVIGNHGNHEKLNYSTNDNLSIGFGVGWRFLGLNLGFRMPFANNDEKRFGKTRSFDLQSFYYFRKLQVDVYAQAYKGMYIGDNNVLFRPRFEGIYHNRPDMRTRNFGLAVQYIFNNRRFSYRAAFVQNEYQKKSAGSFVLGGSLYYFRAAADSAIIPRDIVYPGNFWKDSFNKTNVISLSVNAGYAYTLVVKKHFFLTAAVTAGPGVNYTNRKDDFTNANTAGFDYQLNGTLRLAAGYNSPEYFAGVQYIRLTNRNGVSGPSGWQQFETGSLRVTLAKRFKLNKKVEKKMLKAVEEVKDEVEEMIR